MYFRICASSTKVRTELPAIVQQLTGEAFLSLKKALRPLKKARFVLLCETAASVTAAEETRDARRVAQQRLLFSRNFRGTENGSVGRKIEREAVALYTMKLTTCNISFPRFSWGLQQNTVNSRDPAPALFTRI
jgi:hypothetical protein